MLHLNSNYKIVGTLTLKLATVKISKHSSKKSSKYIRWAKNKTQIESLGHFKWPTIKTFRTIMCRNDELSSTMSRVGCLIKDSEHFILFAENRQTLLKISVIPILLVNNQLNSSLRHIIVTIGCSTWNDMGSQNHCCQYNPNKNCSGAPFMCTVD